ncbi:1766_t:CDS:2, partial [Entrophospora sp. SA101]
YDDDSSSKKIQPNSLIGYNLESDASVFMPMHNINDNGSNVNYVRNFNETINSELQKPIKGSYLSDALLDFLT